MDLIDRIKIYFVLAVGILTIAVICSLVFAETPSVNNKTYTCDKITKIRDADTFECMLQIDPFFKIYQDVAIRVADVDCPEIKGFNKAKGLESKAYAETVLGTFGPVVVKNIQKWSFDRVVADVTVMDQDFKTLLISHGGCKASGN